MKSCWFCLSKNLHIANRMMKLRHTGSLCSRWIRLDLVSSQGELNCLDRDFLGPSFVLHQLLCLAGFANPFTGTLAGNRLESTDHFQSLRKLFKEVQGELQLNLLVNRLKKDMNNQTINECIDLQKSYTSENIWEEVSWPSCVCVTRIHGMPTILNLHLCMLIIHIHIINVCRRNKISQVTLFIRSI